MLILRYFRFKEAVCHSKEHIAEVLQIQGENLDSLQNADMKKKKPCDSSVQFHGDGSQ